MFLVQIIRKTVTFSENLVDATIFFSFRKNVDAFRINSTFRGTTNIMI